MASVEHLVGDMLDTWRMLGKTVQQARTDLSQRSAVLDMRRRFANAALAVSSAIESDTFIRDRPGPAVEFRQRFSESAPRLRYS